MFGKVRNFLKSEEGYTAESLIWTTIVGLGSASVCFGLLAADRFQGGAVSDDMKKIATPSVLPQANENVIGLSSGYTGAVTDITVGL